MPGRHQQTLQKVRFIVTMTALAVIALVYGFIRVFHR